jgi:O-antigen ligase
MPIGREGFLRSSGERSRRLLLGALVVIGALLPPELNPSGMALSAVVGAGLGWIVLRPRLFRLVRSPWGAALLAVLPACWLFLSIHRYATIAIFFQFALAAIAFLAARDEIRSRAEEQGWALAFSALGAAVSLWGLYQAAFSLARTARFLRALGQPELDPMVLRAESGRAFGPFLLPADLGIYLAMVLPLTIAAMLREKRTRMKGLLGAALGIQIAGLAASRSYGAALSLFASASLLALMSRVRWRGRLAAALGGGGLLAAYSLFVLRGSEGLSPLALRVQNWRLACAIFARHPLFGTGPGTFGEAVTRWMRPGMNETVFAHNSFLQVAAEGGLPALALVLVAAASLLGGIRSRLRRDRGDWARLMTALPAVTFLVHNLFDFSAYLSSLLVPFALLSALALRAVAPGVPAPAAPPSLSPVRRWALALLLVGAASWGIRDAATSWLMQRARDDREAGEISRARSKTRMAAWVNPGHPDPPAMLAEDLFPEAGSSPERRREGESFARLAIELRPERAYGHYLLSLYRLTAGDLGEAWLELSVARELFPARELYRIQERRLREMVAAFSSRSGAGDG